MNQEQGNLSLGSILESLSEKPVPQIPLDFDYEPADIVSKQLTKLHSNYEYRVVYLGPRWPNSAKVHRALASSEKNPEVQNPQTFGHINLNKYSFNTVIKSNMFSNSFKNEYYKTAIYYRAFEGMNPTMRDSSEFVFDSSFESANLDCVVKIRDGQYDLFLRVDSNTRGHTLWYFFSIKNAKDRRKITLNICNISRHYNLYEKGMKPYIFSKMKNKIHKTEWHQGGSNITFGKCKLRYNFVYQRCGKVRPFSKLSFEYQFQYEGDEVFFAYCIPYTFSCLLKEISNLNETDSQGNKILEKGECGRSLMGIAIPIILVTDPKIPVKNKKLIVVTGRIHPGQTNGSIMVSGLMKFLCSPEGASTRKTTIFIIIPMMNPDGVVMGNYRTGAAGKDLNRVYTIINKDIYPQIYNIRSLMMTLKPYDPSMFLDFHGHSGKKNTFVYGPAYPITEPQYFKSKVLPKLISTKTQMFRFYSCIFKISESKKQTARAVMLEKYSIPYVFTIESSNGFYYDSIAKTTQQFNKTRWQEMGRIFGSGIGQYVSMVAEYQQFVNQRRQAIASRKKLRRSNLNFLPQNTASKFKQAPVQSQSYYEQEQPEMKPPPPTTAFFLNIIEDIQSDDKLKNANDSQVDSDSDDDQQDLQPLKFAEFNKIIKQSNVMEGFSSKHQKLISKTVKVQGKDIQRKKSCQQSEIQMQILNDLDFKRANSRSQKKRLFSCGPRSRTTGNHIEKDESANILKKDQELNQATELFRLTPSDVKADIEINQISQTDKKFAQKFQYNINQKNKTFGIQKIRKNPFVRYSASKFHKQPEEQYLQSSFFNFNIEQPPRNSVFSFPVNNEFKDLRSVSKKKAMSEYEYRRRMARTATSREQTHRQTTQVLPASVKNSIVEFSFSEMLPKEQHREHAEHFGRFVTNPLTQSTKLRHTGANKTIFPSSFYRIKQQLRGRRRDQQDTPVQSLNIRRATGF